MRPWAQGMKENTLLRLNGIYKFQSKINFSIEVGSYILKTADSYEELIESCRLRYQVFHQEFRNIKKMGIDVDRFDTHFDHLIIIHKLSKKIIGTYRLRCTEFSKKSYTELEFDLTEIYKIPGPHLELGRACIQRDYRNGSSVISLLWRGITEYMNISGAQVLFGCSSIKVNSPQKAALIYRYLQDEGLVMTDNIANPTKNFKMIDFDLWAEYFQKGLTPIEREEAEALIPSLLKSYLKFGSMLASQPAFDKAFDCIDVLTVLKKNDMNNSLVKRFHIVR